jgi:hypothetical protein
MRKPARLPIRVYLVLFVGLILTNIIQVLSVESALAWGPWTVVNNAVIFGFIAAGLAWWYGERKPKKHHYISRDEQGEE